MPITLPLAYLHIVLAIYCHDISQIEEFFKQSVIVRVNWVSHISHIILSSIRITSSINSESMYM